MSDSQLVAVKLGGDDLQLLEEIEAFERLTRSDCIRRALRLYAVHLGIRQAAKPKPKRK